MEKDRIWHNDVTNTKMNEKYHHTKRHTPSFITFSVTQGNPAEYREISVEHARNDLFDFYPPTSRLMNEPRVHDPARLRKLCVV